MKRFILAVVFGAALAGAARGDEATTGAARRYVRYVKATAPGGPGAGRFTPEQWREAALFGGAWPTLRTYRYLRGAMDADADARWRAAVVAEDWFEGTHWGVIWALEDGRTTEALALAESLMDDERVPVEFRERERLAARVFAMRAARAMGDWEKVAEHAAAVVAWGESVYRGEARRRLDEAAARRETTGTRVDPHTP